MMPVDSVNREPGWEKGPVEVLEIKGVRIGEGRPKIIASTTAKTPEAFIALVKDYNNRPELDMIEPASGLHRRNLRQRICKAHKRSL